MRYSTNAGRLVYASTKQTNNNPIRSDPQLGRLVADPVQFDPIPREFF